MSKMPLQSTIDEMYTWFEQTANDLTSLVYPNVCLACEGREALLGDIFCIDCAAELEYTQDHLHEQNDFTNKFWGRLDLVFGAAAYPFVKGGRIQHLLHQFKYKGRSDIGNLLTYRYGLLLKTHDMLADVSVILPVPIHATKRRLRGYNQTEHLADGLSLALLKPIEKNLLYRKAHLESQTTKTKEERFEVLMDAYACRRNDTYSKAHFLLVDDVLTTGATIEACTTKLMAQFPDCRLSAICLSYAV